jgi:hypothetical protein
MISAQAPFNTSGLEAQSRCLFRSQLPATRHHVSPLSTCHGRDMQRVTITTPAYIERKRSSPDSRVSSAAIYLLHMYTAILIVSWRFYSGVALRDLGGLSRLRQPSEKLHNDEVITRVDLEVSWLQVG